MLLISYHSSAILFYFMFMPANTLGADTGNNYMYPKVLSLYETVTYAMCYVVTLSGPP